MILLPAAPAGAFAPDLPFGSAMRSPNGPAVWLYTRPGQKQPITSPEVYFGCGFKDWNEVRTLEARVFDALPNGPVLGSAADCRFAREGGSPTASSAQAAGAAGSRYLEVLDAAWYLNAHPDVRNALGNSPQAAQQHWLNHGMREGRQSRADFSVRAYLARYPDLGRAFGQGNFEAALNHWFDFGQREGRNPRP